MRLDASFFACCALLPDLYEVGADGCAELGQVRASSFTVEKMPAELVFQELDGTGQCRLGNVAFLGRPGEVQFVAEREEISDLMHFHGTRLSAW